MDVGTSSEGSSSPGSSLVSSWRVELEAVLSPLRGGGGGGAFADSGIVAARVLAVVDGLAADGDQQRRAIQHILHHGGLLRACAEAVCRARPASRGPGGVSGDSARSSLDPAAAAKAPPGDRIAASAAGSCPEWAAAGLLLLWLLRFDARKPQSSAARDAVAAELRAAG